MLRGLALLAAASFVAVPALAYESGTTDALHLAVGLVSPHFWSSGSTQFDGFTNFNSLDIGYEVLQSSQSSFLIRAIITEDFGQTRLLETYVGVAKRFYFGSLSGDQEASRDQFAYAYHPRWRFFAGGDLGLSDAVVKTYTQVLQSDSALIEIGPNIGAIYQAGKSVGIEAQLGGTVGYGFSAIAVGAFTLRATLGVSVGF